MCERVKIGENYIFYFGIFICNATLKMKVAVTYVCEVDKVTVSIHPANGTY